MIMFIQYLSRFFKDAKMYHDYVIRNLKKDPRFIFKVNNPSSKLLYKLIDVNPGYLIRFIHLATPDHVKHALAKDAKMVRFFVEYPDLSEELKIAAIEMDYTNVIYMKNLSYEVMEAAIYTNPYAVSFIQEEEIPEKLLKLAIMLEPKTINLMDVPTEEMISLAKSLGANVSMWEID